MAISKTKQFFAYIMTTQKNTVLYTGVTNNLEKRIHEHKSGENKGFTRRYRVTKLIYYEIFENFHDAIAREKQIKSWSRKRKIDLIHSQNPE